MQIDHPFHLDASGRVALTSEDDHIRDLIEQVLFTVPGERVNRPTFGSGLLQLVFAPASGELATATEFLVQGSLQQWLADVIQVEGVGVVVEEGRLVVTVQYIVRRTQTRAHARFEREGMA
jgi:phage baseplate assembly protein W